MHVVAAIVAAVLLVLTAAGPAAASGRYIVAPHDTLFSIARRFHVPLSMLAQVNSIHDPSRIRVGDVLVIPTPPAMVAAISYIVRPGDTLYHLAVTHGTTVQALKESNGLTSPAIAVGQVLRLPRPVEGIMAAPSPTARGPEPPNPSASLAPAVGAPAPVPPAETGSGDLPRPAPSGAGNPAAPDIPVLHPVPPVRAQLFARVRASALRYLGTPYVWGGTTPAGVDCSGLVFLVYSPYVANLPRTSYEQWTAGAAVGRADLAAGDLVFFDTDGSGASHVGIYIGGGEFVHSATTAQRVVIDRLDTPYYLTHYLGARRVL
ncbi:MAG TPA: NlpC/P60 family protein [bacterium]|nr:NlpC/P60 family protein [bacterium]